MSGIIGSATEIVGAPYEDKDGVRHLPLSIQPVIVLAAPSNVLATIRRRAHARGVETAAYIEEMFETGHDEANRAVFRDHGADEDSTVGLALRADKKLVDKITKGAKMRF